MLIVQIEGNVKHPITLDPTVWIFDDRKIQLENAFSNENSSFDDSVNQEKPWNRDEYQQKFNPPINDSVQKFERHKVLENSYLMPIHYFLPNAEPHESATKAILHSTEGQIHEISLSALEDSLLLFALNGKPLKEDGPIHLYFDDGSNQNEPFKKVNKIEIQ